MAKDTKWGDDDNVAKTKDAKLTQEQVDAGVKAVFDHPGGSQVDMTKVAKPDDLVRSVDAAVHGTKPEATPS